MAGSMLAKVALVPDRRLKRVHLSIHPQQGLMVRTPPGFPPTEVKRIIEKKEDWIAKQQQALTRLCPWREYCDGQRLPLLDGEVRLLLQEGTSCGGHWRGDVVAVRVPTGADRDKVRSVLSSLYRQRAREYIPPRVAMLNQKHFGVSLGRVAVRGQKKIFGSCSAQGNLSFNWRLLLAPAAIADYVIIHELAHRLELNHSPRFWQLVEGACPSYRECRSWLRQYGVCLCI